MVSTTGTGTVMLARPKKVQAEHSLHKVMQTCPNWRKALAYLCVLLRIALCCGHSNNPHVLVNIDYAEHRLELIHSCWPDCLVCANVAPEALETVLMKDSKAPMMHTEVLTLASPWITQFLYDNCRIVAHSMDDPHIFGLGNFFGLAQRHSIMMLLQMFTRPNAHLLPIEMSHLNSLPQVLNPDFFLQANGFATFLTHQMTKEMVYHICYQALLERLVNMWGTADVMPDYPTPVQIYAELCKAATMLIQAEDDPGIIPFKAELRGLCTITETDVYRVGRPNRAVGQKKPLAVNNIVYVAACPAPSLINFECFRCTGDATDTGDKCNAWLLTLSPSEVTLEVESHANRTLFGFPLTVEEVPDHHKYFQEPDDLLISLLRLLKTWVDPVTYSSNRRRTKALDVLKSDIHILGLKKQQAQAEVDMFSEALVCVAEFEGTDDGTCSGSTATFASLPSDTYADDCFDGSFSTSYASSNASVLL
ncbi:hypothetical protein F4604DRAFT_1925836 [Suillus subluteus]|nr:hypothetical protein F4604DRAFT_1925836 [Suillus subluteus]